MSLTIDLNPELESLLRLEAQRLGLSLGEHARRVLEKQFKPDRERFVRSFGRWADDPQLATVLEQIDRDRHTTLIHS